MKYKFLSKRFVRLMDAEVVTICCIYGVLKSVEFNERGETTGTECEYKYIDTTIKSFGSLATYRYR